MRTVGIICEYNPFHSGHAWHLRRAKEESGADYEALTRLYEEKETAEALLLDLMEQWEAAQS